MFLPFPISGVILSFMNKTTRRRPQMMTIVNASRSEGPLYTVQGEDQNLYVFDSTVSVLASNGKVYIHKTFTVKGYHPAQEVGDGDWAYATPNFNYKTEVQAFIAKIEARGTIDLNHWEELVTESFAEREAYNRRCEADERAWEGA